MLRYVHHRLARPYVSADRRFRVVGAILSRHDIVLSPNRGTLVEAVRFAGSGENEAPLISGDSVDALAEQVGVAVVPRVLLDHVGEDIAERERLVVIVPGDVEGLSGVYEVTGTRTLCAPDLERLLRVGVRNVEFGTAAVIGPLARGVGWLLSETGVPRRIKAAYLTDDDIAHLAAYAARLRSKEAA